MFWCLFLLLLPTFFVIVVIVVVVFVVVAKVGGATRSLSSPEGVWEDMCTSVAPRVHSASLTYPDVFDFLELE